MQDLKRILPFVLERLDEGCLALFIGAGIPASEGGLPSGNELRDSLLREMGEDASDESLPEVAARFENERDRVSLFDFLKRALAFEGDIRDEHCCPTYKMLLDLPVQTFVTTNFDNLFELVAGVKRTPLRVFKTDGQLADYRPNEQSLLKVHGDLEVAANEITITSADYDTYRPRCPQFSHRISEVFHVNTVVFLGYSLSDPDLNHLYRTVLQSVGALKRKSFAVLVSDPGVKVRDAWASQKIDTVVSTARDFVHQLLRAYRQRTAGARQQKDAVRVTSGRRTAPPKFSFTTAPNRTRKAFAYFVARQKALVKAGAYSFCTIDALQTSAELLDPRRKIAQAISTKTQEISRKLRDKGYYSEVLPPLDQVPERIRRRTIEEADFCIVFVSSPGYQACLNSLYGAVAPTKPMLVFIHNNFRARLNQDLLFRGLFQAGADLTLFKSREVSSCGLLAKLEELLETKGDEWLARTLRI